MKIKIKKEEELGLMICWNIERHKFNNFGLKISNVNSKNSQILRNKDKSIVFIILSSVTDMLESSNEKNMKGKGEIYETITKQDWWLIRSAGICGVVF